MSKAKILLAEDERSVALDAKARLESLGYEVVAVARTGEEAIREAWDKRPDLALVDVGLPGDIDGRVAARRIRERLGIPVIYVADRAEAEPLHRFEGVEAFEYVLKPLGFRELHLVVETALRMNRVDRQPQESWEAARRGREIRALRALMNVSGPTFDFDQMVSRAQTAVQRVLDVEAFGVVFPEDLGRVLSVRRSVSGPVPADDRVGQIGAEGSLVGRVYASGVAMISGMETEEPDHPESKRMMGAELAVPIVIGEDVVGVLHVESGEPEAFDEEDVVFLMAVAGHLGMALENARLFEAGQGQRRFAEALQEAAAAISSTLNLEQVLDRILEQVERVVSGDAYSIVLMEDDHAEVTRYRGQVEMGEADEFAAAVVSLCQYPDFTNASSAPRSVVVPDTAADKGWTRREGAEWLRSCVGAAVQIGDSIVGYLSVLSTEPDQFDSEDGLRLESFARHAATAIENARLYERLRTHADTLGERVEERTAQLRVQYARLEAILSSTVNGIVVTGRDGELLLANPVARDWLTRSLLPEEAALLRETIQDLGRHADEDPQRILELTGLDLQLRAAAIREPGVGDASAVVAIHDISHLKALSRMKSRFVSNVSHELRTPIATIKLLVHLMQKHPERWKDYLEPLAQEANHQANLVEDILEISRVDAGRLAIEPERTNLQELVELAVANQETRAQERGLTISCGSHEPGPVSLVDTHRLAQVLGNLIDNAIRHSPEGSDIVVSAGKARARGRDWAVIEVTDTGAGIPEDELPYVFDRFFRGERSRRMQISGTGLGLAIVKEIVELHGGRVTVESEVDEGSTFTVWLPLAESEGGSGT